MTATILVVDDDPSIVHTLKENFEGEGYHVSCAYDGQMAIVMARQEHPDVIVLDVDMPVTNGLKTLEYLRAMENTRDVPVIFLTGVASAYIYPYLDRVTRVGHLKKPVDFDDLNEMVRTFLQKYSAG